MTEFKSLCLAEVALVLVVAEDRDPPMDVRLVLSVFLFLFLFGVLYVAALVILTRIQFILFHFIALLLTVTCFRMNVAFVLSLASHFIDCIS